MKNKVQESKRKSIHKALRLASSHHLKAVQSSSSTVSFERLKFFLRNSENRVNYTRLGRELKKILSEQHDKEEKFVQFLLEKHKRKTAPKHPGSPRGRLQSVKTENDSNMSYIDLRDEKDKFSQIGSELCDEELRQLCQRPPSAFLKMRQYAGLPSKKTPQLSEQSFVIPRSSNVVHSMPSSPGRTPPLSEQPTKRWQILKKEQLIQSKYIPIKKPLFSKLKELPQQPKENEISFGRLWRVKQKHKEPAVAYQALQSKQQLQSLNLSKVPFPPTLSPLISPSSTMTFKSPISGRSINQGNKFLFEKLAQNEQIEKIEERGSQKLIEERLLQHCVHLFPKEKREQMSRRHSLQKKKSGAYLVSKLN